MDRTFANKRVFGGSAHGAIPRYIELLQHGDLDPGHVKAFQNEQNGVRNNLRDFRRNNCKPPGGRKGQFELKCAEWVASISTPTKEDVQRFHLDQAVAGGGAPVIYLNSSGIPVVGFQNSSPIFVFVP